MLQAAASPVPHLVLRVEGQAYGVAPVPLALRRPAGAAVVRGIQPLACAEQRGRVVAWGAAAWPQTAKPRPSRQHLGKLRGNRKRRAAARPRWHTPTAPAPPTPTCDRQPVLGVVRVDAAQVHVGVQPLAALLPAASAGGGAHQHAAHLDAGRQRAARQALQAQHMGFVGRRREAPAGAAGGARKAGGALAPGLAAVGAGKHVGGLCAHGQSHGASRGVPAAAGARVAGPHLAGLQLRVAAAGLQQVQAAVLLLCRCEAVIHAVHRANPRHGGSDGAARAGGQVGDERAWQAGLSGRLLASLLACPAHGPHARGRAAKEG